eukprot:Phypoly_transcript_19068.p1 GENE.Phypoly_transcript_19068~~Phypoly_transcript_19068.p1  ORF type:complete len:112 (+),score=7.40 Phypoly_transcript_19068:330-665(+)
MVIQNRWITLYVSAITVLLLLLHILPSIPAQYWFNLGISLCVLGLFLFSTADNAIHSFVPRLTAFNCTVRITDPLPLASMYTFGMLTVNIGYVVLETMYLGFKMCVRLMLK